MVDSDGFVTEVTDSQLNESRKYVLHAAIVRLMKARRTMQHNELIGAVEQQVQQYFRPTVAFIKRCIENLIDMAYLERDAQHPDIYHYLA